MTVSVPRDFWAPVCIMSFFSQMKDFAITQSQSRNFFHNTLECKSINSALRQWLSVVPDSAQSYGIIFFKDNSCRYPIFFLLIYHH